MKTKALFVSNLFPDAVETYRGLDNATVLHQLADRFEFRVIAPRSTLPFAKPVDYQCRSGDELFEPVFPCVGYVPKCGSLFNHRLMRRALREAISGIDFDFEVIISAWIYPDCWAAVRLAEDHAVPSVSIAQGSDVHGYLRLPLRRGAVIDAVQRSTATITRSQSLADLLIDTGCEADRIQAIHNGTDVSLFRPRDRARARDELNCADSDPLLLYVGNLLPVKNPLMLLEVLAKLDPATRLVMIGQGPMESDLRERVAELGLAERVQFTGGLPAGQVSRWMNAADLLCMTSHNEGLPNVIVEALASGLSIVATDVGGISERVDRPERGLLVNAGDVPAYVAAVEELLGGERRDSRAENSDLFSWRSCSDHYQRVINAAMGH